MAGNTFGKIFKLTTFGESHGPAIGGIIDGCPAGIEFDHSYVQECLERRRPGSTTLGTSRNEKDEVTFLSGIFEGKTTGTPIGFTIKNADARSKDYSAIKDVYRPSHADFTFDEKYGIRDYKGGGRTSARETACRVVAGAVAKQLFNKENLSVHAFVSGVGDISVKSHYNSLDLNQTFNNEVRCPDPHVSEFMASAIEKARTEGDSLGGVICCVVKNSPIGLGEPVFDKINARLASAMMGINAVKGFEIGSGFSSTKMRGSEHNDEMEIKSGKRVFKSNYSGGIQGGLSNGEDIYFNVAFKPVASISSKQKTINKEAKNVDLELIGRHDPCVVPRAVPIVEAMTWLVLADFYLIKRTNKL